MKNFKSTLVFLLLSFFFQNLFSQNVGISDVVITPDASSILEMRATNKGMLAPRVALTATNSASPITSPANSLLVYNTATAGAAPNNVTPGFYYWDSATSRWVKLLSGTVCHTLQNAYDGCTPPASGRNIVINGTNAIDITNSNNASISLRLTHSNNGVSISTIGTSTTCSYPTIQATTASTYGVVGGGTPAPTSAILGNSTGRAYGVSGQVQSTGTAEAAVYGSNLRTTGGSGVIGRGVNGVVGETTYPAGYGVWGYNSATPTSTTNAVGTYGYGYVGVWGETINGQAAGVFGQNVSTSVTTNNIGVWGLGWIGVYGQSNITSGTGSGYGVVSDGDMGVMNGTKYFVINHPKDPGNKMLRHACIESPEILNLYRGVAQFDAKGIAVITLPDYFEEINTNYSYLLTPIGKPACGLYIKQEIIDGKFVIAGGEQGAKVSWVVYAERNDRYIRADPEARNVEVLKKEKDTYLSPKIYGQPESKSVFKTRTPKGQLLTPPNDRIQQTEMKMN